MVKAVDQVEAAPLLHGERAENDVRNGTSVAEEMFATGSDGVQTLQFRTHTLREFVAALHGEWQSRRDGGGSHAAIGESPQAGDHKLAQQLAETRLGACCAALVHAGFQRGNGASVGIDKVLDDLLDAPFTGVSNGSRLRVSSIQPPQCIGYFSL